MHFWNWQILQTFFSNHRGIFLFDKRFLLFLFTVIVVVFLVAYYWNRLGNQYKTVSLYLGGQKFTVGVADSMALRAAGLSGRSGLRDDEGMYFIFNSPGKHSFWMKDMEFPIDIVWIKGDRVVGFSENVQPEPNKTIFGLTIYRPPEEVDRVLEVSAGTAAKYGWKVGDVVKF